jgi:hypothetical protein
MTELDGVITRWRRSYFLQCIFKIRSVYNILENQNTDKPQKIEIKKEESKRNENEQ